MSKLRVDELESLSTGKSVLVDDIDSGVRVDLADPDKGAAMVRASTATGQQNVTEALDSRVIYVDTIVDLQTIDTISLVDGQQVSVKEYYAGTSVGGGEFYWDADGVKSRHDGGTVISTSVPYPQNKADYYGAVGETDPAGTGVFVRKVEDFVFFEWFGAEDGDDATDLLNLVLADHDIVKTQLDYLVNVDTSISLRGGNHLYLGKSTLTALASSNVRYDMIRIVDASNTVLDGGVLVGDRDIHIGTTGEHGYGVYVSGVTENVKITGVTSTNFWGDGFYIGNSDFEFLKNITMDGCVSDNNRRQGLSVTSGQNITIKNSEFKNTNGTAPEAGIDIEPNVHAYSSQKVRHIIVENCYSHGNAGTGIAAVGRILDRAVLENSGLLHCSISNCHSYNNGAAGIGLNETAHASVTGCNVSSNNGDGIHLRVSCDNSVISNNRIYNSGGYGIHLFNGAWSNVVSGNIIRLCDGYAIRLYNSDSNSISGNNMLLCRSGIQLIQSARNSVSGNVIKESEYHGLSLTGASTVYNIVSGNIFHNVGFSSGGEVVDRFYQSVVELRTGASFNMFKNNLLSHDTGKEPAVSYIYVRNSETHNNKFIYNSFQSSSVTRRTTVNGPAEPNNEVIEESELLTHPW